MNRSFTLFVIALSLSFVLWLMASLSINDQAVAKVAQLTRAQGIYTVEFQNGVLPAAYAGAMDTFMDYYDQGAKRGGHTELWVTSDDKKRSLLKFELSQYIPQGARVISATLTLYVNSRTSATSMGLKCYQVLQPWLENEATWNVAQQGVTWWGPGCDGASRSDVPVCQADVNTYMGGTIVLDLTTVVQAWVDDPAANHGLLLQGEPRAALVTYKFASSNHTTQSYRPKLKVVYGIESLSATPTLSSTNNTPAVAFTPSSWNVITSTFADWKFDSCLKTGKSPPHVRVAGPETMLIMWKGVPDAARLRVIICNTNPNKRHSIYLNGHRVGYTPTEGTGSCECNDGTNQEDKLFEYPIDPGWVVQGENYITITNDADPYDEWKASHAHIVLMGHITGTTRTYFGIGYEYNGDQLKGAVQLPIGYDPGIAKPLLISVPGTGEDKDDALNRYAIRANEMGWLLASLDLRRGWNYSLAKPAKSPSLAVQHDIMALLKKICENYNVDRLRIYLAGFSTGGGIAATVAAKYPDVFAGVVDYAGPTDYADWYQERGDIRTELEREFSGGPTGNFEYPRRSSRSLARNLQYVPMRVVHGTADNRVLSTHSQKLYEAMTQFYNPTSTFKEWITRTVGHEYPIAGVSETDLQFLAQHALAENPHELHIVTDEGKAYYWLHVAKVGVSDDAWRGFVEVDARYDPDTKTIWITAGDWDFAEGKPLKVTLDLGRIGLSTAAAYDVEEYDEETGRFNLLRSLPVVSDKLILTVPVNELGHVKRAYTIYPASGVELEHLRLQQGLNGYSGVKDTYIVSDHFPGEGPREVHGSATILYLGYDWRRKALVSFDLGTVPKGKILKGARLTLHLLNSLSQEMTVQAYQAYRHWLDTEATWFQATATDSWELAGAEASSDRAAVPYATQKVKLAGPYVFNLTALVQSWLNTPENNHGLIFVSSGPWLSRYGLASSEYGEINKRPLLEIWYMDPTPTPTATPTSTSTALPTFTGTPTATASSTPTHTSTPTFTRTWTPTVTPSVTPTGTPTPTRKALYLPVMLKRW